MPELPEVEITVNQLNKILPKLSVKDVWSDLPNSKNKSATVKNPIFFKNFKKATIGAAITDVERRGKNILINLDNGKTILIHMKISGHLLYGSYLFRKNKWIPEDENILKDPKNRFIHFVFSLSDGKSLAFSDLRKFGKITLINQENRYDDINVKNLGPDPLDKNFTFSDFFKILNKKPNGKIKTVLIDQNVIVGIGNIYSDEILWKAEIHPEEKVGNIPLVKIKKMYEAMKNILEKAIRTGGVSTSDFRDIYGKKGNFQNIMNAYQRTGEKCGKKGCGGVITRKKINGRNAHFCNKHQKLSIS